MNEEMSIGEAIWKLVCATVDLVVITMCGITSMMCFTDNHRPSEYTVYGVALLAILTFGHNRDLR